MLKFTDRHFSRLAIATLVAGVSFTYPAHAADDTSNNMPAPATGAMQQDSSGGGMMKHDGMKHAEERINTLHDKLNLNSAQEAKWDKVAKVMRQNEASVHKQIEARHKMESATAVDDLKSYEKVVSAHEAGLKRLVPVFENFYNSLTDDQKANADDIFSKYEGRKASEGAAPGNAPDITPGAGDENNNAPAANAPMNNAPANTTSPTPAPNAPAATPGSNGGYSPGQ